jgi:hypothetical protein
MVMVPVSGRKLSHGSSVVIRHWIATPRSVILSCEIPSDLSVAPAAIRICACTRSMPVTSSVIVCST